MKNFYLLLFLCSTLFCYSQDFTPPNYEKIKQATNNASSPYHYPKLIAKFQKADSSMTLNEKRHLYYGFVYQKNYSPFPSTRYLDSLRISLKKPKKTTIDFNNILKYSDSLLVENPFNVNAYNNKSYAYSHLKDAENEMHIFNQKKIIYDAILSSGNGLKKVSAYFIIFPSHEHIVLKLKGLEYGGSQSSVDKYEYLSVEENDHQIDGLFFDVSASKNHMKNLFNKE